MGCDELVLPLYDTRPNVERGSKSLRLPRPVLIGRIAGKLLDLGRHPVRTKGAFIASLSDKKDAKGLVQARSKNLRQLLLRATRTLNGLVEEELARRGYERIRLSHSSLLANLDLEGNSITAVAERAGVTKQAMGVIADELEAMGYITRRVDAHDGRARTLNFSDKGYKLMLETFAIVEAVEEQYGLRTGLAAFMGVRQLG